MKHRACRAVALVLSVWLAAQNAVAERAVLAWMFQEVAILQIRVIEGEGVVHVAGGRAASPITVQIVDGTGRPVGQATVSFRLPEEGPSGTFSRGLRTEVITTGPEGRASVSDILWDPTPGGVQVRITAVKEGARAGTIVSLYLSDAPSPKKPGTTPAPASRPRGSRTRWIVLTLVVAGAAAAGLAVGLSRRFSSAGRPPSSAQISSPTVTAGSP
jgi:hypothetical protein